MDDRIRIRTRIGNTERAQLVIMTETANDTDQDGVKETVSVISVQHRTVQMAQKIE